MPRKQEKPREPQPATLEIIPLDPPNADAPNSDAPKPRKPRAKAKETAAKSKTTTAKPKAAAKPRKAKVKVKSESGELVEIHVPVGEPFQHPADDPIGDLSDGEAHAIHSAPEATSGLDLQARAEMAAHRADTTEAAVDGTLENHPEPASASARPEIESSEEEFAEEHAAPEMREPPKLERLQKILSQAGIASRRRAEELITEGRVQVNGQVVTQLGAKADAGRDHIRVDGKLLMGAERHRYFVLNKPKGFVTTVSDPEGRPTVMEFFSKMRERLYPVGRLDYQSEGLLLVTNDGELANQLTRAASGVEKTYLVKVAGQPTEEQLDTLRSGVAIDREQPGSGKVHTSPAVIRQVRRGDNPWFEVVLIEGRNRELRKMFSAIGHFVEKIRRVGYGPLVLDLEPGKLRELEPEELAALRLAAAGKWKARRPKAEKLLPKEAGKSAEPRAFKSPAHAARPFRDRSTRAGQGGSREQFGRRERPSWKPREQQPGGRGGQDQQGRSDGARPQGAKPAWGRPQNERFGQRSRFDRQSGDAAPGQRFENRPPAFRPQQREAESGFDDHARRSAGPRLDRTSRDRNNSGRPGFDRPSFKRPAFEITEESPQRFDKPTGKSFGKPRGGEFAARPAKRFDKPAGRSFNKDRGEGFTSRPPARFDKPAGKSFGKPRTGEFPARPASRFDKSAGGSFSKERGEGFASRSARFDKPRPGSFSSRPPARHRDEDGARPFRSESGPPHSGQSRPAPGGRPKPAFGAKPGAQRTGPRPGGSRPAGNRPGGSGRPAPGGRSRPAFGGKPGFKRSGPRPGGNRPGGNRSGGKRG
jgi:23S rRNA pseudouridine2605 synthase